MALSSGGHVRLFTERTASKVPVKGCVLVAYGDKKLLDIIDGCPGVTQVLALPWISADVASWVKTWNAVDLNSAGASALRAALRQAKPGKGGSDVGEHHRNLSSELCG